MWSNVISIDKCFSKEIDYLIASVKKVRDLSYAIEESKDRIWIYLASLCEKSVEVEEKITFLVEDVILTYMKTRFFLERLPSFLMTHPLARSYAHLCILTGVMRKICFAGQWQKRRISTWTAFTISVFKS